MILSCSPSTADDVERFALRASKLCLEDGKTVDNTIERPMSGLLMIDVKDLRAIIDGLHPLLPREVLKREDDEYRKIVNAAVACCEHEFSRVINSRRAVAVNTGCLTYQHLYVRNGVLHHSVHMRGQDVRKMLSDFWLMLVIDQRVLGVIPSEVYMHAVHLAWMVDCFHAYKDPESVPI